MHIYIYIYILYIYIYIYIYVVGSGCRGRVQFSWTRSSELEGVSRIPESWHIMCRNAHSKFKAQESGPIFPDRNLEN